MFKNYFLYCLSTTLCFLSSCTKADPHVEEAYSMIHRINKKFKNTKLNPFGTGGSFNKDIEKISLTYMVYIDSMDEEHARKILIETTETILQEINSEQSIRPYLRQYPFEVKDLELMIGFFYKGSPFLQQPNIAFAQVWNGKVEYAQYINKRLTDIYENPYNDEYFKVFGVNPPNRAVLD